MTYPEFCDLTEAQAAEYLQDSKHWTLRFAVQEIIERMTGSVLDVGCGNGIEAKWYMPDRYCGCDISEPLLKAAKRYNPTHNFVWVPVDGLPFTNESFDIVFCISVMEHQHSLEAARKLFNEMVRVAKQVVIIGWHTPPWENDTRIITKPAHFGTTGYANKYNRFDLTRDFIGSMIRHYEPEPYEIWEIIKKNVTAKLESAQAGA